YRVAELGRAPLRCGARLHGGLDRLEPLGVRVRPEAVLAQPLERLEVAVRGETVTLTDAVDPDRKWPSRRDRRVLLAQRPCGRVARVRGRRLPLRDEAFVELAEAGQRHVDLAANLEDRGSLLGGPHLQGDRADRP